MTTVVVDGGQDRRCFHRCVQVYRGSQTDLISVLISGLLSGHVAYGHGALPVLPGRHVEDELPRNVCHPHGYRTP